MAAYAAVDLGTLGGDMSWACALNHGDRVVGYSTTAAGGTAPSFSTTPTATARPTRAR